MLGGDATLTAVQECVACFTGTTPSCVNKVQLGEVSVWDKNSIDARYAEHQEGTNGLRYRDWVALHCSAECTQQARLAAHCIAVKEWHVTQVPWLQANGAVVWVKTVATLPVVSRTMRGDTLKQAVESRYMHDPHLLSEMHDSDEIIRGNVEMYDTDDRILIAYTPLPKPQDVQPRMQMMAFQVVQCTPPKKNQVRWCDDI